MSTRNERLRKVWRHFEETWAIPVTTDEAIEWAVNNHLLAR